MVIVYMLLPGAVALSLVGWQKRVMHTPQPVYFKTILSLSD